MTLYFLEMDFHHRKSWGNEWQIVTCGCNRFWDWRMYVTLMQTLRSSACFDSVSLIDPELLTHIFNLHDGVFFLFMLSKFDVILLGQILDSDESMGISSLEFRIGIKKLVRCRLGLWGIQNSSHNVLYIRSLHWNHIFG